MSEDSIPPYFEVVRLTHPTREETLAACVTYRNTPAPEMSLGWLRNAAYKILSGQLTLQALCHTIENKLPPNARPSVKLAVESLLEFVTQKNWIGERLPDFNIEVGRGFVMPVRVAGRFHSEHGRWVVGLQPRLDDGPDLRFQMQTWLALTHEAYCTDPLAPAVPLILDVSRDLVTDKRGFNAIDTTVLSLISRDELNLRMNLFIDCYIRAIEIVPVRARRQRKEKPNDDQPTLPGIPSP